MKFKIIFIAGAILLCPIFTFAATIHVPADQPTIQAGINAASENDTVLVADGTYTGNGNRDIDFKGKSIVVRSVNGPEATIINAEGLPDIGPRGFYFHSGEDTLAILDGFTIKSGYGQGGGIFMSLYSSPTIRNCIITENHSSNTSGGIHCYEGSPIIIDCIISFNEGGIELNNTDAKIINCDFIQNISHNVGGLHCHEASPTIINCNFIGNEGRDGGGLGSYYFSDPYVENCIFEGNEGTVAGGGLHCDEWSSATLSYCLFSGNICDSVGGGAIWCEDSTLLTLLNCTFVNNNSSVGSAIAFGDASTLIITNCIISYNMGEAISCYDLTGEVIFSCSDIYGNSEGDWVGCIADQIGISGNFSLDPRFCDTTSVDFTLYSSSPCLPSNNECEVLIGMYGSGCNDVVTAIGIENEILSNVISHSPKLSWGYYDPSGYPEDSFEIAVGTDDNWDYAEMWNPAPFEGPDTFVTYAGADLIDGETYYLRLRIQNSLTWSEWFETTFRMNSVPSAPIPIYPLQDEVTDNTPILWIENSTDAEGDSLVYDFSGFHDTDCVAGPNIEILGVIEGIDSTGGQVIDPLGENCIYWWSARAYDGYEYSDGSETQRFFIDGTPEPPTEFQANYTPDTGYTYITNMLETFWWSASSDGDPMDSVYYKLHMSIDSDFTFVQIIDSIWQTEYTLIDSLEFGTQYWWKVEAVDNSELSTFTWNTPDFKTWMLGDPNGDYAVNIIDITFLIAYLYQGGNPPYPMVMGDINGDCAVNILDITYLIAYLYMGGPPPEVGCE